MVPSTAGQLRLLNAARHLLAAAGHQRSMPAAGDMRKMTAGGLVRKMAAAGRVRRMAAAGHHPMLNPPAAATICCYLPLPPRSSPGILHLPVSGENRAVSKGILHLPVSRVEQEEKGRAGGRIARAGGKSRANLRMKRGRGLGGRIREEGGGRRFAAGGGVFWGREKMRAGVRILLDGSFFFFFPKLSFRGRFSTLLEML
jgi:hypothetical protein